MIVVAKASDTHYEIAHDEQDAANLRKVAEAVKLTDCEYLQQLIGGAIKPPEPDSDKLTHT